MATTRPRISKRENFQAGQLVTEEDIDNIGSIASQQMLHLLAELVWRDIDGAPLSGFPGGACALTNGATDLEVILAEGVGLWLDITETDEFEPHLKPIVVETAETFNLDAHDPSNGRWDLVSLAPNVAADQSGARTVKDVSTGVISSASVTTRRRWSYTKTVTKGTPATSPSRPSLPSGHLAVAYVLVPASSGAVTIEDARDRLGLGAGWNMGPGHGYATNHVVPDASARYSGELEVTAGGLSLNASVNAGEAWVDAERVGSALPSSVTAVPDPTDPLIAIVWIDTSGTIGITHGTAAPSPSPPTLAAGQMALCSIDVGAAATSISTLDLTDQRTVGGHIGSAQIRASAVGTGQLAAAAVTRPKINAGAVGGTELDSNVVDTTHLVNAAVTTDKLAGLGVTTTKIAAAAVTPAKLSVKPVIPDVTVSSPSSGKQRLTIQMRDWDGNAAAAAYTIRVVPELDGYLCGSGSYFYTTSGEFHPTAIHTDTSGMHAFEMSVVTGSLLGPGTNTGWSTSATTYAGSSRQPGGGDYRPNSGYVVTNSSGQAVVDFDIQTGGSNVALWVVVEPVNVPGNKRVAAIQF